MIHDYIMTKLATVKSAKTVGTILRSMPASLAADTILPGSSSAINNVGALSGSFTGNDDLEDLIKYEEDTGQDLIPGMAARKLQRKRRVLENALKKKKKGNKTLSEHLGVYTSTILPTIAGGIIGGSLNKDNPALGALLGAGIGGIGSGLAQGVGLIGGNFTKGRDVEDLEKYYNSNKSSILNYLVPGSAGYNMGKNLMATDRVLEKYKKDPEFRKKLKKKLGK